jgi:hypothetical protein
VFGHAQIGVVLAQEQRYSARDVTHAIRFARNLGDEVIDEHARYASSRLSVNGARPAAKAPR